MSAGGGARGGGGRGGCPARLPCRTCRLLRTRRLSGCRIGRHFRHSRLLAAFAIGHPDVIDRMFDRMQARACGKHPAREDPFDLALQRYLVDFDETVGIGRLGRRTRIANARRHLQRAELHGLVDRDVERNDAAGNFVETGKYRRRIGNTLRRRSHHHFIARLRRGIGRLRRVARRPRARRQSGRRWRRRTGGALLWRQRLSWRRRCQSARRRRQRLRLNGATAGTVRRRRDSSAPATAVAAAHRGQKDDTGAVVTAGSPVHSAHPPADVAARRRRSSQIAQKPAAARVAQQLTTRLNGCNASSKSGFVAWPAWIRLTP